MSGSREIDTMNTSSIDLICCALGGLLLIMLFVATLVRERVEQAALAPEAAEEDPAEGAKGPRGRESAPPRPLIVTLRWSGKPMHPFRLVAYPPRIEGGEPKPQDQAALTEANGAARPPGGGTYVGFFDREAEDDQGLLRLVIPRGLRTGEGDPKWQFDVVYGPVTGPTSRIARDPAADLDAAFVRLNDWAEKFRPVWDGGQAQTDEPTDRGGRLDRLCRSAVFPILNDAAKAAAATTTRPERHTRALAIVRAIDRALEQGNLDRPEDRFQWSDLFSGPLDRARTDSGHWLAQLYRYAGVYKGTGTGPDGPVTFWLTSEAYKPYSSKVLVNDGEEEIEIPPDAAATKRFAFPPSSDDTPR